MSWQSILSRLAEMTRPLAAALLTIVVGGVLAATVAFASIGSGIADTGLDQELQQDSLEAIREEKVVSIGLLKFYAHYLAGFLSGDLGLSPSFNRPVRELLGENLPLTLGTVG